MVVVLRLKTQGDGIPPGIADMQLTFNSFYDIIIKSINDIIRNKIVKNMTLRGLEPDLADKLKQAARQEGKSVNQFVLDMLKKRLGLEKERRFTAVHRDLDHLFGRWSPEEFDQIQGKIDAQRQIDAELWR